MCMIIMISGTDHAEGNMQLFHIVITTNDM